MPPRMKLARNFVFCIISAILLEFAVSFDLYVFFLASENDLWVFLTRKIMASPFNLA